MKDKKILCVILARGGSKGIPGKNIKDLAGHPLIAYTICEAIKSNYLRAPSLVLHHINTSSGILFIYSLEFLALSVLSSIS